MHPIEDLAVRRFQRDGYLVVPGLASPEVQAGIRETVARVLDPLQGPAEFEAETGYPGAPPNRGAEGGDTPRRLLAAYSRDPVFREWACSEAVSVHLRALMGSGAIAMSQCHHNCVMTKAPGYSSATLWHQDIRYWSFDRPELVSVWLALGPERDDNGCLRVIPGSHIPELDRGRLDADLFLRDELPENQGLIAQAVSVTLEPGDVLFFHCRVFHAASMNRTDQVKVSAVFTYHERDNQPIPGTRSAQYPSIPLPEPAPA